MKRQRKIHYRIGLLKLACGAVWLEPAKATCRVGNVTCKSCIGHVERNKITVERRSKDEKYQDTVDRYIAGKGPCPER